MIFATDNDAGTKIMAHLYGQAATKIPQMQREALDRAAGQQTLDLGDTGPAPTYTYEPPWTPPE
jgi:hypothetical protein